MSDCLRICLLRTLAWWFTATVGFTLTTWIVTEGDVRASLNCAIPLLVLGTAAIVGICYMRCRRQP